jgi:putative metallohydrolase (TIGR04338 family)
MKANNKEGQPRDTQRSKLYKAERTLENFSGVACNERLETVAEIVSFVNRLVWRAPIQARYGNLVGVRQVAIKDGRGRRAAGGSMGFITMPTWSRSKLVVCHELAHTIALRKYGQRGVAWHGPEYAAIYLDLVQFGISKETADKLRAAFKKGRVKVGRKNPVRKAHRPAGAIAA